MKVIVCGAGQVGFNIASHLARENNDVTVVDLSPELTRKISGALDVQSVQGHASHPDVLERAGAASADMLIAVTQADEVNMVACQVAHALFNIPTKVARIRSQTYLQPEWNDLFSRENLPIDVIISPELEVARAVLRRLEMPGTFDMFPFAKGKVRIVGVRLTADCPVVDTPLRQLTELFPDLNIVIVGIVRGGVMFVPHGDDQMLIGDDIYFCSDVAHVSRAMDIFGHRETEARRVLIVGGGNVGLFLALSLESSHPNVSIRIIEYDRARAELISERLERAVVINGDAMDIQILREANVFETETIVAVSNDDQVNILASLMAKREGANRAITLLNNPSYGPLIRSLGIDVTVDPKESTVSSILQLMRRGRIKSLHNFANGSAEVIEGVAMETSPLVGAPLRDIDLPEGIVVGTVIRAGKVITPRGATEIQAHDTVIIFALANMVKKVEALFSVKLEFF